MSVETCLSKCVLACKLALTEMTGRFLPVSYNAVLKRMDGSSTQNFESTGAQIVCGFAIASLEATTKDQQRQAPCSLSLLHRPAGEHL